MALDKYGVEQVRRLQQATLEEVRVRLAALMRSSHTKTAEETQEIDRLSRQVRELEEALAQPDPQG